MVRNILQQVIAIYGDRKIDYRLNFKTVVSDCR